MSIMKMVTETAGVAMRRVPARGIVLGAVVAALLAAPLTGSAEMGQGGNRSGWQDQTGSTLFRFIRLQYDGEGWDDGMDATSRADINFLAEFKKLTGFRTDEVSTNIPIAALGIYRKGFAPPFVYMTGNREIKMPPKDVVTLRDYLLGGGLLFADCGSPQWDKSFRSFMLRVFPEKELRTIADDDPIFHVPYVFANGAPPLWHFGGNKALGIRTGGGGLSSTTQAA